MKITKRFRELLSTSTIMDSTKGWKVRGQTVGNAYSIHETIKSYKYR